MNEFTRKLLITILVLIIFIICVTLVITGQRETGAPGLFRQSCYGCITDNTNKDCEEKL